MTTLMAIIASIIDLYKQGIISRDEALSYIERAINAKLYTEERR